MRRVMPLAFGLLMLTTSACGSETAIVVDVDLSGWLVPSDVDRVHLELRGPQDEVLGHNFELAASQTSPSYKLLHGQQFPQPATLVGFAFLGVTAIVESVPQEIAFEDADTVRVAVDLSNRGG